MYALRTSHNSDDSRWWDEATCPGLPSCSPSHVLSLLPVTASSWAEKGKKWTANICYPIPQMYWCWLSHCFIMHQSFSYWKFGGKDRKRRFDPLSSIFPPFSPEISANFGEFLRVSIWISMVHLYLPALDCMATQVSSFVLATRPSWRFPLMWDRMSCATFRKRSKAWNQGQMWPRLG